MSLQRQLLVWLSVSFITLWVVVATIQYAQLSRQIAMTLDQRLAASATMVAGLIARQPRLLLASSNEPLMVQPANAGVACLIRAAASGDVLLQTQDARGAELAGAQPGFATRTIDDTRWRLYTLRQDDVLITTADRMSERTALQNGILLAMAAPFALALLGGLVVLWFCIRRGLAPLQRLYRELAHRESTNLSPLSIGPAPVELRPVLATLNELLARVGLAVRREQRFASHAAHEFRTPLTGIKTNLQVADKLADERARPALANAMQGVQRLQQVTDQLLMLARLDRHDRWPDCACLLQDVVETAFFDLADEGRVRLSLTPSPRPLALPQALAAVALRNLVDNALRHTPERNPVDIDATVTERGAVLTVRDFGGAEPAPMATDPPRAGERVWGDSHGLGLTIVESIVARFAGQFFVEPHPDGLEWTLVLPLAAEDV